MFNSEMVTVNGELVKLFITTTHHNFKDVVKSVVGVIATDKIMPPDNRSAREKKK